MATNVHCGVDPTENIQLMGENREYKVWGLILGVILIIVGE